MNALWSEIPHVGILFDCFPDSVWKRPDNGVDGLVTTSKLVTFELLIHSRFSDSNLW